MASKKVQALADKINASGKFTAKITEGYYLSDTEISPGCRYVLKHNKTRHGSKLTVFDKQGVEVYQHNTAEPGVYGALSHIEHWIEHNLAPDS